MKRTKYLCLILITMLACVGAGIAFLGCASEQLSAPENFRLDGRTLIWDEVENASGYVVFVDDVEYNVAEPNFDLTYLYSPAEYEVEVLACGNNREYLDSAWSLYNFTALEILDHGYDEQGFEYTLLEDGKSYAVSKGTADLTGHLIIPDYFLGLPVTEIPLYGFNPMGGFDYIMNEFDEIRCNKITTKITLPKHVKNIYGSSFMCFVRLEEVIFPEGLEYVSGFRGCTSLRHIDLPQSVKKIGANAFRNCPLEELVLPQSLKEISDYSFCCDYYPNGRVIQHVDQKYTKVVIPEGVTGVARGVFKGCYNLEEIIINAPLEAIKIYCDAFDDTAWYNAQPDGIMVLNGVYLIDYKGEMPEDNHFILPVGVQKIALGAFTDMEYRDVFNGLYLPDGTLIYDYLWRTATKKL